MGAYNVYHERQIRELCGLHALNNLFQGKNFVRFYKRVKKNTFSFGCSLFQCYTLRIFN